jgi:hypothetical protein
MHDKTVTVEGTVTRERELPDGTLEEYEVEVEVEVDLVVDGGDRVEYGETWASTPCGYVYEDVRVNEPEDFELTERESENFGNKAMQA